MKKAIHCKTKEQFKQVLEVFEKKRWKWCEGQYPLLGVDWWNDRGSETGIRYEDYFSYASIGWYESEGYQILSFEDFLKEENINLKNMKQEELKKEIENLKTKLEELEKKVIPTFVKVIKRGYSYIFHCDARKYGCINYHYWNDLPSAKDGDILEVVKEILVNDGEAAYILKDKAGIEYIIGKQGVVEVDQKAAEPEYKKGQWLYCHGDSIEYELLFRYDGHTKDAWKYTEAYWVIDGSFQIDYRDGNLSNDNYFSSIVPATKDQIERILTIVAKSKGFKEGVKFKSPNDKYEGICKDKFEYALNVDILYSDVAVYNEGKWAEIIKEEPKQFTPGQWTYYKNKENGNEFLSRFKEIRSKIEVWTNEYYEIASEGRFVCDGHDGYLVLEGTFPATKDQIERILKVVAEHKGFKEGMKVISPVTGSTYFCGREAHLNDINDLVSGGVTLYDDDKCKWATLVKEEKYEIAGYEVKFDKDQKLIKIGCKTITLEDLKAIQRVCKLNEQFDRGFEVTEYDIHVYGDDDQVLSLEQIETFISKLEKQLLFLYPSV